ncbi:MAG: DUF2065 domain-containing protein [Woeseiaceae bacterium]|jgi:uncharacterized protein YjeT (DUF2065 family)|nr:DUF2065 domain-containing protein [Woeseiaceae bacterium]MDG1015288.1 DUF2065 domain-containing protein [Woeseiaceae bacterium]MDG1713254.1 DUF2065 domain-containing protein [Woeseiaceae bacterium]MDG1866085.1 DUF2065 domain-containing protein [Woeseiaceae bacterium]
MWQEVFIAVALFLIIEGFIPFVSPARFRVFVKRMSKLNNDNLRIIGFISMLVGLLMLFLITA